MWLVKVPPPFPRSWTTNTLNKMMLPQGSLHLLVLKTFKNTFENLYEKCKILSNTIGPSLQKMIRYAWDPPFTNPAWKRWAGFVVWDRSAPWDEETGSCRPGWFLRVCHIMSSSGFPDSVVSCTTKVCTPCIFIFLSSKSIFTFNVFHNLLQTKAILLTSMLVQGKKKKLRFLKKGKKKKKATSKFTAHGCKNITCRSYPLK